MNKRRLWTPRRELKVIGRKPSDVYRGRLAEDYDGIGQFVLVTLAGSSVAAAYKARIAAGDFGGGRIFPRGTPVVVHSYRGQLEVFLGNHPTGCSCGENFNRTVESGLGSGVLGTYLYPFGTPESSWLVNGSAAEADMTTALQYAWLPIPPTLQLPFEALFKLSFRSDSNPFIQWSGVGSGGRDDFEFFAQLQHHNGQSNISTFASGTPPANISAGFGQEENRTALDFDATQDFDDVEVTFDEFSAQLDWFFRFYVDRFGVYARMWPQGGAEPLVMRTEPGLEVWEIPDNVLMPYHGFPADQAAWAASGGGKGEPWTAYETNVGGFRDYDFFAFVFGSNGVAGTQPKLVIDDICILQGGWCGISDCGITDLFNRTIDPDSWGHSDSNHLWSISVPGNSTMYVEPGTATIHCPASSSNNDAYALLRTIPFNGTFDLRCRIRFKTEGHNGGANPALRWNFSDASSFLNMEVHPGTDQLILEADNASAGETATTNSPWALNTDSGWVNFRWQAIHAQVNRVKFWTGESEPVGWDLTQLTAGMSDFTNPTIDMQILVDNQPQPAGVYGDCLFQIQVLDIEGINRCTPDLS